MADRYSNYKELKSSENLFQYPPGSLNVYVEQQSEPSSIPMTDKLLVQHAGSEPPVLKHGMKEMAMMDDMPKETKKKMHE